MMVLQRPRKESAKKAPNKGSNDAVPLQTLTLTAASAVDCPSAPVRQVTRFEPTPVKANLSANSTPAPLQYSVTCLMCIYIYIYIGLPMIRAADLQPPESDLEAGRPLQSTAPSTVLISIGVWGSSAIVKYYSSTSS